MKSIKIADSTMFSLMRFYDTLNFEFLFINAIKYMN
jgi:hypothetical protein